MKFSKELKCICCLIKCSKYLYYAKKILCVMTVVAVAATAFTLMGSDGKSLMCKLKGMMK